MEYQLALPPELGLSLGDFVAAWNANMQCRAVAEAQISRPVFLEFNPSLLAESITLSLTPTLHAAADSPGTLLQHLVAHLLTNRAPAHALAIKQVAHPDGTCLLVVSVRRQS